MKPLHFTRLHLENWKNFADAEVDLLERAFVVGPNASGKSNLLDALLFLHDIVEVGGGLRYAVDVKRGGLARLRSLFAVASSEVGIAVTVGTVEQPDIWRYELRLGQGKHGQAMLAQERIAIQGTVLMDRPD